MTLQGQALIQIVLLLGLSQRSVLIVTLVVTGAERLFSMVVRTLLVLSIEQ